MLARKSIVTFVTGKCHRTRTFLSASENWAVKNGYFKRPAISEVKMGGLLHKVGMGFLHQSSCRLCLRTVHLLGFFLLSHLTCNRVFLVSRPSTFGSGWWHFIKGCPKFGAWPREVALFRWFCESGQQFEKLWRNNWWSRTQNDHGQLSGRI